MTDEVVELYRKHRPKTFKDMVGQTNAINMLEQLIKSNKVPHALMFSGASGCGKNTAARIICGKLECGDMDYQEVNCASLESPIDHIRSIQQRMGLAPVAGKCRIWVLDEVQSLSRASFAQQALLKMLEDTPRHVYFILATTDPAKLIKTIITRCTVIDFKPLAAKALVDVLKRVVDKEKADVSNDVLERIAEVADGSARKALVQLHQIIEIEGEEQQLNCILASDTKTKGIDLARALMNPRAQWKDVAKILKDLDEEPEGMRYLVLGYATTVILGGGPLASRAFLVISAFENNFYDSKKAGLVRACFEVVHGQ